MNQKIFLLSLVFAALILAGCTQVGPAPEPVVGSVTPEPFVAPERVEFVTPDGWLLPALYYAPLSPNNKSAVLLHSLNGEKSDWGGLALELQKNGFGVLAVDQRGHGGSFIEATKTKTTFAQFKEEDFLKMVDDVRPFVEFMGRRSAGEKIYLIGSSIGANIALNYGVREKKIAAVVLLSPGIDYRGIKTLDAVTEYGARPALIVAGKDDEYSALSAKQLSEKAATPTLVLFDKAGHGTQMLRAKPELAKQVREWLEKN